MAKAVIMRCWFGYRLQEAKEWTGVQPGSNPNATKSEKLYAEGPPQGSQKMSVN